MPCSDENPCLMPALQWVHSARCEASTSNNRKHVMPKEYRKKPVVIQATQLTDSAFDAPHPNPEHLTGVIYDPVSRCAFIDTLEGRMRADIGDFIITGVKGEKYPCKPDIFKATYDQVSTDKPEPPGNMHFGAALRALKNGFRVARIGWNGKGMWIIFMHGGTGLAKFNDGPDLDLEPCFGIMTAQGKLQPGWHPSQPDMLAEDWYILD